MAFKVCDSTGQRLAYVYFEEEPGRRSAAKLLSNDEAPRIASNIAKLPAFQKDGECATRHKGVVIYYAIATGVRAL